MPNFLNHTYIKRQQSEVFKCAWENVWPDETSIQIDFSQNYTCKEQNKIQAVHWNNRQVSVFTVVASFRIVCDGKIFALVSDYAAHDKYVVDNCLRKVFFHMLESLPNLNLVQLFSDGAASHFK